MWSRTQSGGSGRERDSSSSNSGVVVRWSFGGWRGCVSAGWLNRRRVWWAVGWPAARGADGASARARARIVLMVLLGGAEGGMRRATDASGAAFMYVTGLGDALGVVAPSGLGVIRAS